MDRARTPIRLLLAAVMGVAGVAHLLSPRPFIQHLPPEIPARELLVAGTGLAELALAAGLLGPRRWRPTVGIALAAYLVAVFPANVYAAVSGVPIEGVPDGWPRWARLPLQLPLVWAAWWSTRRRP